MKLMQKREISKKNLLFNFLSNFNAVFFLLQNDHLIGLLNGHKKIGYFI
jgi:hypothetical protein